MIRVPFLRLAPLTFVLAVAACSEPTPDGAASPGNGASAEPSAMNAAAPTSLTAIPEPFRGRWDASGAACAGKASEMRLIVGPDSLRFHESLGRVEAVRAAGADTIALDLAFEGEGEQWRETRALRLLPDGRLVVDARGGTANRVRCEGAADEPALTAAQAPRWQSTASGEGAGLSLATAGGAPLLALFCPAGSGEIVVNVPAFRPVASEERMSVGSGGTVFALVADTAGDKERGGVTGRGAFPAANLATILAGAGGIAVNYGAQNSGPYAPPPAAVARDFLAGCPAR